MATEQQIKMLMARAKVVKMPLKRPECEELDNGEIDELLEKIKTYGKHEERQESKPIPPKAELFDGVRFGLAAKLVIQKRELAAVFANRGQTVSDIEDLYALLMNAERHIKETLTATFPELRER